MRRFLPAAILLIGLTLVAALAQTGPNSGGSATPSGSAGGDLTGTYPNPSVGKIIGTTVNTVPASGNLVGTTDTQTLTGKSIDASEVNSGTIGAARMPALTGDVTSSAGSVATTLAAGNAGNLNSGTLLAARMPALTGDCTTSAGAVATTCGAINGNAAPAGLAGFTDPINLGISATASGNVLTIALKGANGSDPSSTNQVYIPFRSTTLATGTPVWATQTAALSIATPASGATLGSVNTNVPFRFWIVLLYNGTTLDIGLINCSTSTTTAANIYTLNEGVLQTSTVLNGSSTAAGTVYSGTARTSFAMRVIGYLDYGSGLTTAGTYASSPTTVQLRGPSVPLPGAIIQRVLTSSVSNTTVTAATTLTTTNVTANITPSTTPNLVRIATSGTLVIVGTTGADITTTAQIYRGTTAIGKLAIGGVVDSTPLAQTDNLPIALEWIDGPASTSAQTYAVKIQNSANTASTSGSFPSTSGGTMILEEIQG